MKQQLVVVTTPRWGQYNTVKAVTGIPKEALRSLCKQGLVRVRKTDDDKRQSACIYSIGDVEEWLNSCAKTPEWAIREDEPDQTPKQG